MRILIFVCGVAVLLTTFGYAHIIHHYAMEAIRDGGTAGFWLAIVIAGLIGMLSFIGGGILIRLSRRSEDFGFSAKEL